MKKLVTVYGTLLSGFGNWKWCLDRTDCVLLGEHVIELPVKMLSLGGFPGLIKNDTTNKIHVETYEVPNDVYKSIEHLEGYHEGGNDRNMYNKMKIDTPFGESEIYIFNSRGYYGDDRFVHEDEEGILNWRKYKHGATKYY